MDSQLKPVTGSDLSWAYAIIICVAVSQCVLLVSYCRQFVRENADETGGYQFSSVSTKFNAPPLRSGELFSELLQAAIDGRTTRHIGYRISQSCCAISEWIFGWGGPSLSEKPKLHPKAIGRSNETTRNSFNLQCFSAHC
jgi:hypothetical protein